MESALFNVLMYVLLFIRGASSEYITADIHYFSSSMSMDVHGTVRVHNKKGSEKILLEFSEKDWDEKKEKARLLLRFDEKKMVASASGKKENKPGPPIDIPDMPDKLLEEAYKDSNGGELPKDAGKILLNDLSEELSVLRFQKWGAGVYLLLFKDKKTGLTPKIELHGKSESGFVFYRFEVSSLDFSKIDKDVFEIK